jgi:pimeloyl-ACP methyl ester carboxylesterase
MNRCLSTRLLRRAWFVVLLAGFSSMTLAAGKNYLLTAPDGVKLAVQESGNPDGPTLIFIHGLLGSHLGWERQTSSPELKRYRLITYDLRGHGLSDRPTNADAYTDGRRYADDLAAVIKSTGSNHPVLVGWSLGGVVISNYLAAYGDADIDGVMYVDGVVELDATLITPHPSVYAGLASGDLKTHLDAVRTFLALCFHTQPDRATFEQLLSIASMASWTMTRATPSMNVFAAQGLPKARVPVLMLYGKQDELVQPEPSMARAKQLNDHVQTLVYDHSGHAPFLEEAHRFNHDWPGSWNRPSP